MLNRVKFSKKTKLSSGNAETAVTYMRATKLPRNVQFVTTQEATLKFGVKTTKQSIKEGVKVTEEGQVYLCEICGNKVKVIEVWCWNSSLLRARHDTCGVKLCWRRSPALPFFVKNYIFVENSGCLQCIKNCAKRMKEFYCVFGF